MIFGESIFESAFVAVLWVAMFAAMNIFSVFLFFDKHYNLRNIINNMFKESDLIIPGIYMIILMTIFYFILFHKKKYLKIINEIENKTKEENRKGNISAILYQVFSFIFFIIALIYNFN
ncbi:MAG: hypothetical protein GXO49_04715 [Chlorobi bacterium]|nr:hypothetical protein [Chlorobiota bacterium]